HHRRIGDDAVFVEMMLGAEEGVVAERLGELRLAHHLAVKLRHRARQARMVIVDRKDRVAHRRVALPVSLLVTPAKAGIHAALLLGDASDLRAVSALVPAFAGTTSESDYDIQNKLRYSKLRVNPRQT